MSFRGGLHPEISSLIHIKDQARDYMIKGEWLDLLNCLHAINIEIQEKDQDKDLKASILQELKAQGMFATPAASARDMFGRRFLYMEWCEKTIQILWVKDYLVNKKYSASGLEEFEREEGYVEA